MTRAASSQQVYERRKQRRKSDLKRPPAVAGDAVIFSSFFSFSVFGSLCLFGFWVSLCGCDTYRRTHARAHTYTHTHTRASTVHRSKCKSVLLPFETEAQRLPASQPASQPYCRVFYHYQTSFYLNYSHLPETGNQQRALTSSAASSSFIRRFDAAQNRSRSRWMSPHRISWVCWSCVLRV